MGLSPFIILSLVFVVIGIRTAYQIVTNWRQTWDENFTLQDRQRVDMAGIFVLLPVSVALHELGHAVAIWLFGGEVVDFGYYGFAGYVSYFPIGFSDVQQTIVSAAGSLVNLILIALALGFVFFKRTPMRASINELLIQFSYISGLNAFIAYPILDLATGLNGDWQQMYTSGVPWLTALAIAVQVAVLVGGYWLATNPRMRAIQARLTSVPHGFERGWLGGIQPRNFDTDALDPEDRMLHEAADRVKSGWGKQVKTDAVHTPDASAVTIAWYNGSTQLMVAVRRFQSGDVDIVQMRQPQQADEPRMQLLHRWQTMPGIDDLTVALRVAMESVDSGSTAPAR